LGATAFALGAVASAFAASDPDALARAADAKLDFARTYQGRYTCDGATSAGQPLRATMLMFTDKPGIHNFQVTFLKAKATEPNISELWSWRWSYGDVGSWFAVPDAHSPAGGFLFTSDGPRDGGLTWKEHVADSTTYRTFEPAPGGTLRFAVHDHTIRGDDASYVLHCKRAKAAS